MYLSVSTAKHNPVEIKCVSFTNSSHSTLKNNLVVFQTNQRVPVTYCIANTFAVDKVENVFLFPGLHLPIRNKMIPSTQNTANLVPIAYKTNSCLCLWPKINSLTEKVQVAIAAIGNPERHVRKASFMRRNLSYYCLLAPRIHIFHSSRTFRSW